MGPIQVFILDEHQLFADALALRLAHEPGITVIGSASSVELAHAAIDLRHPDIVTVELAVGRDGDGDVVQSLRARYPTIAIVVVAGSDDVRTAARAVKSGAHGFVGKAATLTELLTALRIVHGGEAHIPAHLLRGVLEELRQPYDERSEWQDRLGRLTSRELTVIQLMVAGLDPAAIAERLFLSLHTVRTHIKNILAKLEVHSSLEAVSVALRAGLRPNGAGSTSGSGTV